MQPRDVGGGGRLEGLELGAADEQVRKACSHEKMAVEGGSSGGRLGDPELGERKRGRSRWAVANTFVFIVNRVG